MANSAPVLNSTIIRVNHLYENTFTGAIPISFFNDGVDNVGNFVSGAYDPDGFPLGGLGIAIAGVTGITGGIIEYSIDSGFHWLVAATPPAGSAIVFKGETLLRYTPPANANGERTMTFHAWDGTGGYNSGDVVSNFTTLTGGANPFSAESATHTIVIDPNDGHVITNVGGGMKSAQV